MPVDGVSDEPTRLRSVIETLFGGQSGTDLWKSGSASARLALGAGDQDDCAVIEMSGNASLVAGSDYVRGPQFTLYRAGLLSEYDLGYFLVVANLSDIAAMGAHPLGVLTVVRYPQDLTDESFRSLMRGIADACAASGTFNIGGDIGTAERIILSGTALGVCSPGKALARSGARPGDLLCVSGDVGSAGAAVAYFGDRGSGGDPGSGGGQRPGGGAESEDGPGSGAGALSDAAREEMLTAWRRPVPRIGAGRLLSEENLATACMDTSDGLRASIEELGRASGVGFVVREEDVVLTTAVAEVAAMLSLDPLTLAFSASVDFELAFTVPPGDLGRCRDRFAQLGLDIRVIGEAIADPAISLARRDGGVTGLTGVPWRHQGAAFRSELSNRDPGR